MFTGLFSRSVAASFCRNWRRCPDAWPLSKTKRKPVAPIKETWLKRTAQSRGLGAWVLGPRFDETRSLWSSIETDQRTKNQFCVRQESQGYLPQTDLAFELEGVSWGQELRGVCRCWSVNCDSYVEMYLQRQRMLIVLAVIWTSKPPF